MLIPRPHASAPVRTGAPWPLPACVWRDGRSVLVYSFFWCWGDLGAVAAVTSAPQHICSHEPRQHCGHTRAVDLQDGGSATALCRHKVLCSLAERNSSCARNVAAYSTPTHGQRARSGEGSCRSCE